MRPRLLMTGQIYLAAGFLVCFDVIHKQYFIKQTNNNVGLLLKGLVECRMKMWLCNLLNY